jgi:hypothetical protein
MKQAIVFCLLFIIGSNAYGQANHGKVWVNGQVYSATTKFTSTNSILQANVPNALDYGFAIGHSNICDSNGNLILLSNGGHIFDPNMNFIDGGQNLSYPASLAGDLNNYTCNVSQFSMFLPLGDNKYYYINGAVTDTIWNSWFFIPEFWIPMDRLLFSTIDMAANGGAGKVVKRMHVADSNNRFDTGSGMMACRHGNGKDWWLVKPGSDSSTFYTYKITSDSIYPAVKQVFSGAGDSIVMSEGGQTVFNTQGTQMASCKRQEGNFFRLLDFDRCTGTLSNARRINYPYNFGIVGLSFSPNGRFIYVTDAIRVHQFDTYAPDSASAWYEVAFRDTIGSHFKSWNNTYLGSDGKVYIGVFMGGAKQMSVINKPNLKGALCEWCPRCLRFDSLLVVNVTQPPCMPNYALGAVSPPCEPVAIHQFENLAMSELVVYPNPATDRLHLRWDAALTNQTKLEVRNIFGQVLFTRTLPKGASNYELDISNLPSACYLVKVANTVRRFAKE